jgi:hypothetical protein
VRVRLERREANFFSFLTFAMRLPSHGHRHQRPLPPGERVWGQACVFLFFSYNLHKSLC